MKFDEIEETISRQATEYEETHPTVMEEIVYWPLRRQYENLTFDFDEILDALDRIPPVKKCLSYRSEHGFIFRPPADEHRENNMSDLKIAIKEARENELDQKMNKLRDDIATWKEGPPDVGYSGSWNWKQRSCTCQSGSQICRRSPKFKQYC